MNKKIRKAIIPCAGFGTRFLPATISIPKEMITVVDKPVIQYIVEEAAKAGIEEILIILRQGKEAIIDHFRPDKKLIEILKEKNKVEELKIVEDVASLAKITVAYQAEQKGLANAIYAGKEFTGSEPFVVLLGDTIIEPLDHRPSPLQQLVDIYEKTGSANVLVEYLENIEDVKRYGIVKTAQDPETLKPGDYSKVVDLVEKPEVENAPSRLAIACRYIFNSDIYDYIDQIKPGHGGEYQITDAMKLLSGEKDLLALVSDGKKYDIGNKLEYIAANIELARKSGIIK